jgi:hypothetical protein
MSKMLWILVISLGLAFAFAAYTGIRLGNSLVKRMKSIRVVREPPNEYVDLFKGQDPDSLQFQETTIYRNRNPISRYRYHDLYEILETKLNFSDTGRLCKKLEIVQGGIPPIGFTSSYSAFGIGSIYVDFENLDHPGSDFKKLSLTIQGRGFENAPGNDSVLSYFLEQGYFSIGRSPGDESDIFSSERENYGGSGSSAPTVLLFKSRGNFVFLLVGSPVQEKTKVPQDLLLRLVSGKR